MPPTLIASIYGMNIKLPVIGGEKIWDFVLLIGMMLFSVLMALFLFRKRKMIK
jgi:magnesium transporter